MNQLLTTNQPTTKSTKLDFYAYTLHHFAVSDYEKETWSESFLRINWTALSRKNHTILYFWLIDWFIEQKSIYIHPSIDTSSIHIPKNNHSNKNQITKVSHNKQRQTTQGQQQQKERNKVTKTQEYIKLLTSQAVSTQICRSSKSRHDQEDQSKSLLTSKAKRESETIWSSNSLVFELILANQNQKTHT